MTGLVRLMRLVSWLCFLGLAVLSLTPSTTMVRTGLSGHLEHVVAYLITGVTFMLGYPERAPWRLAFALAGYAAVLEVGQMAAPGRHAGYLDWAAGAAGSFCAALVIWGLRGRRWGWR